MKAGRPGWRALLPAAVWATALLALGSIPDLPGPDTGLPLDKLAHFGLYGVLGLLAGGAGVRSRRPAVWLALVFGAALVGAADELNQSRIAGRSAELADWIMDVLGIVSGFALRLRRARPLRQEQTQ